MSYVMFSCCKIYYIVCVVSSTNTSWNFVVSLEIFTFREIVVLLNQLIVYFLIIHYFYLFVNGVTPRDFVLSIYNYTNF